MRVLRTLPESDTPLRYSHRSPEASKLVNLGLPSMASTCCLVIPRSTVLLFLASADWHTASIISVVAISANHSFLFMGLYVFMDVIVSILCLQS